MAIRYTKTSVSNLEPGDVFFLPEQQWLAIAVRPLDDRAAGGKTKALVSFREGMYLFPLDDQRECSEGVLLVREEFSEFELRIPQPARTSASRPDSAGALIVQDERKLVHAVIDRGESGKRAVYIDLATWRFEEEPADQRMPGLWVTDWILSYGSQELLTSPGFIESRNAESSVSP